MARRPSSDTLSAYDDIILRNISGGRHVVDTAGRERPAARDTPSCQQAASERTVGPHGLLRVVGTRRVEAALPAEPRRKDQAVEADQAHEPGTSRGSEQPHPSTPAGHRRSTCARESNSSTSDTNSCERAPAIVALATSATSLPPSTRGASSRHAARRIRRARLRRTAPPTRRPATNATDPGPGATNTITRSPWNAWPEARTRPTSWRLVGSYADSRVRPFARRRARIARPARVRMRMRKPCRLWRRRLFGWKVRLVIVGSYPDRRPPAPTVDGAVYPRGNAPRSTTPEGHITRVGRGSMPATESVTRGRVGRAVGKTSVL